MPLTGWTQSKPRTNDGGGSGVDFALRTYRIYRSGCVAASWLAGAPPPRSGRGGGMGGGMRDGWVGWVWHDEAWAGSCSVGVE